MFWKTEVNELQSDFFSSIECLVFVVYYPKKLCWLRTWSAIWQKLFSNLDEHMHHIFLQYCTDITLHIKLAIHQVCLETVPSWVYIITTFISMYLDFFLCLCDCDRDGPDQSSPQIGQFSGNTALESVYSTSNQILIKFHSDFSGSGFFVLSYHGERFRDEHPQTSSYIDSIFPNG